MLPAVTMNLLLEMAQWDALDSLKLFMHSTGKNIIHSVKKKMQITRDLRSRIGKTENIEASWSTGCSKMAVRR